MRLLLGLLLYLGAVIAIVGAAAAVLSSPPDPGAQNAATRPAPSTTASPRIQAWLERKAEGIAFAEKERAAAQAERERADALRARLAATPAPYVAPRAQEARAQAARAQEAEDRRAAERARAARAKESVRREARRRLRDLEADTAYSYAFEPRRPAYADDLLTRRDRYGY
jgi:hypothetical protein